MSIVRMKRVRLLALRGDRPEIMNRLMRLGCVEVSDLTSRLGDEHWSALVAPSPSDLPRLKSGLSELQAAKNTLSKYAKQKKGLFSPRPAVPESVFFKEDDLQIAADTAKQIGQITDAMADNYAEIGRLSNRISFLAPWTELNIPLETGSSAQCAMSFGVCPSSLEWEPIAAQLKENAPASEVFYSGSDREQHYFFLLYHKSESDVVREILKSVGYSRVEFK